MALLYGRVEAADQSFFVERLRQKADRTIVKRLSANTFVGNGRDYDKRNPIPVLTQVRLHVDATHAGHANIGNDAPCAVELS